MQCERKKVSHTLLKLVSLIRDLSIIFIAT